MNYIVKNIRGEQSLWLKRAAVIVVLDCMTIIGAYFLALFLRFDFVFSNIPMEYLWGYLWSMPYWVIITLVVFYMFRLYHSIWTFASMPNITNVFNVYLRLENGTGTVGVGDCIASISGQAMAATATWDGVIEIEEKMKKSVIGGGIEVKRISAVMDTDMLEYVRRTYTEQVQGRYSFGAFCRPVEQEEE